MKTLKRVMLLAAHSDDDVLGCGGTLAKHSNFGDLIKIVYMTNGVGARTNSRKAIARRQVSTRNACAKIGVSEFKFLDYPDNKMDSVPLLEVVKSVESEIKSFCPDIVYTHHSSDLNVDHKTVYQATITAVRPLPEQMVSEIRTYEVPSSTEWSFDSAATFKPNLFVDIADYLRCKIEAFEEYSDELRDPPHPRSIENIEALARVRGAQIGYKFAEAFEIVWKKSGE